MPNPQVTQGKCNMYWADSMQAVLDQPTSPNEQLYFAEKSRPIIWVRETDGNGNIKNPMTRLTFQAEQVAFGPEANFVTKEEHQKLYNEVRDMRDMITKIYEALK
jgi:hypothetical protein